MDRDSLSISFLDYGLRKQVVRKGHSANEIRDIEKSSYRSLTFFICHPKERDVHTKTSTVVLFIRGANLGQCLNVQ